MPRKYNILIVDDEPSVVFLLKEELTELEEYAVTTALDGAEAINLLHMQPYDVVLLDVKMPRVSGIEVLKFIRENYPATQVIILTNVADVKTAIETMKLGAYDFVSKPYTREDLLATVARAVELYQLTIDNELMKYELSRQGSAYDIVGESEAIQNVVRTAEKIAQSDAIVHIQGPSGTGKELVAHLIHTSSSRKNHPFVIVNCASIPDSLLESELFGHEQGAFTNAIKMKQGLVEVANCGTLFLDEVGDISTLIQPKLLRFLESGEFRRVGGTNAMKVNVRILSATNKDLHKEVEAGRFREDLLYRLNVVTIRIPPLKERKEDIPLLLKHFLRKKMRTKNPKRINTEAMQFLLHYDWPGNVRELEHVIEGAVLLSHDDEIRAKDLPLALVDKTGVRSSEQVTHDGEKIFSLEELEKRHIEFSLRKNNFNRMKTSEMLGITPKTLYLKIKKYRIVVPQH
ncbi:MAG: sigma-54-dependent Fis family transcriptional regulator [Bacteroidota bacterium]|nr:sigma-54-dependent Fis family transcriptional regulator [Bacteroidota bacterium]